MNDVDQQRWRLLAIILVLFGMTLVVTVPFGRYPGIAPRLLH